ncbi:hypothetical protein RND81_10G089900 [Saponaria officinalis]|uniref:Transposase, Ptta/En/Spm, plant n=1 Tax=Saponaria officinalis TaxID=3572 RepID=A0AAW1HZR9_SAPOF
MIFRSKIPTRKKAGITRKQAFIMLQQKSKIQSKVLQIQPKHYNYPTTTTTQGDDADTLLAPSGNRPALSCTARSQLGTGTVLRSASPPALSNGQDEPFTAKNGAQNNFNISPPFKPRRRTLIPNWPDDIKFEEKEEVLTVDGEGNYKNINDAIQPHDVWHAKGVKYFVSFNEFYQPLRKGGHILIRIIGDVAKKERYCPIRETNWHHDRFIIPEGDNYDQGILKRTGKSMRQYRHMLKKTFFKPTSKTKAQIYERGPAGHPRDSWMHLVDYWYSEEGQKLSKCGEEARGAQNYVHTTGATSYANIRADLEEANNREPTALEMFKHTHLKKDKKYVKDTCAEDFVDDVDAYVQTKIFTNPSKTKVIREQIENEAFNKLMYGEETPKRPVGYGYGVKQSDVFGVRSMLKKEDFNCGGSKNLATQNMEKIVANLAEKNEGLMKTNEELMKQNEKL